MGSYFKGERKGGKKPDLQWSELTRKNPLNAQVEKKKGGKKKEEGNIRNGRCAPAFHSFPV